MGYQQGLHLEIKFNERTKIKNSKSELLQLKFTPTH